MERYLWSIRVFCIVVAAAALLIVSGCGDSGSADPGAAVLSGAEFSSRMDELCKASSQQVENEYVPLFEDASSGGASQEKLEQTAVAEVIVPTYGALVEEVRSLKGSNQDEQQAKAFADEMQKLLNEAQQKPAKAFESIHFFTPAAEIAKKAGFRGCALALGGQQVFS